MLTPDALYRLASISPTGITPWGDDVPSQEPGVYVISIDDPANISIADDYASQRLLWRADQVVVYIGRARQLQRRLRQFRRHVYGRSSPHRGGQAILLLDSVKTITWAETEDYPAAEHRLITAFQNEVGRMPFGNRVRSARMGVR